MGRKTPQGRAGKLIRPLTTRITNRFTNRDGLRLTTANLVVSNCSTESDQTKGESLAVQDRVPTGINASEPIGPCYRTGKIKFQDHAGVQRLYQDQTQGRAVCPLSLILTTSSLTVLTNVLSNDFSEIPKRRMAFASYR